MNGWCRDWIGQAAWASRESSENIRDLGSVGGSFSGQEGFRVLTASQWQSAANLISFKLYTAKLLKHETDPIKGINRKTAKDILILKQFQSSKNPKSKLLETRRKTIWSWLSSVKLLQRHVGKLHYNEYVWLWTTHNLG